MYLSFVYTGCLWYVAVIGLEIKVMHNSRARLIMSAPSGLCEHCKTLLHIKKKWLLCRCIVLPHCCLGSVWITRQCRWYDALHISCVSHTGTLESDVRKCSKTSKIRCKSLRNKPIDVSHSSVQQRAFGHELPPTYLYHFGWKRSANYHPGLCRTTCQKGEQPQ